MSKEANAEGEARLRVSFGKNNGGASEAMGDSSTGLEAKSGFSRALLIFIANFDRLDSLVGELCLDIDDDTGDIFSGGGA
jgi:hypothetical protein